MSETLVERWWTEADFYSGGRLVCAEWGSRRLRRIVSRDEMELARNPEMLCREILLYMQHILKEAALKEGGTDGV